MGVCPTSSDIKLLPLVHVASMALSNGNLDENEVTDLPLLNATERSDGLEALTNYPRALEHDS